MSFSWVLLAPDGTEIRATEEFDSRSEAEAWMGAEWAALRAEGAVAVSLREDGRQIYDMSLLEA